MAITVSDNNTRGDSYDGAYGGSNIGSGAGGGTADDSYYQGVNAWGRKINSANNDRGIWTTITSIDTTTAGNEVLMSKSLILNNVALNQEGLRVWIGSSTSNYNSFVVGDEGSRGDVNYPAKGGWVIRPLDPNVSAWVDSSPAAPTLTAITQVGVVGNVSSVSKDLNIFIDASDFSRGLYLVGTSPDGSWQDFIDYDEGTSNNRFGHVTTIEGVIYLFGGFVIGRDNASTPALTTFTDSNKTIVFPGGSVDSGWNNLEYDLDNASTVISLTSIVHSGTGRDNLKRGFRPDNDVNGGTNVITINDHGFKDLEAIVYDADGGSTIGITDGTTHIVGNVTTNTFQLFATRAEALAGTPVTSVSPTVGDDQQFFTRTPSTLPDLTITNSNGSFTADTCNFNRFRNFINTSGATWTTCTFTNFKNIDCAGATFTDCTFEQAISYAGEAETIAGGDEPESLSGCIYNANSDATLIGHAMLIDAAPTGGSLDFNNLNFNGYGPAVQTFDASADVNASSLDIIGHPYSSGDPVFYMPNDPSDGSTGTPILTTNQLYFVGVIGPNEISIHESRGSAIAGTNAILLLSGVSEVHALYSGYAAVHNSTNTDITINVVNGGSTPSYRNSGTGTVTVNNNVSITLTGIATSGPNGEVATTEIRVYRDSDNVELAGIESAGSTFAFSVASGTAVSIVIHNLYYVYQRIGITPTADGEIPIQQVPDRNFSND